LKKRCDLDFAESSESVPIASYNVTIKTKPMGFKLLAHSTTIIKVDQAAAEAGLKPFSKITHVNDMRVTAKTIKSALRSVIVPFKLSLDTLSLPPATTPKSEWCFDFAIAQRAHNAKRHLSYGPSKKMQVNAHTAGDDTSCANSTFLCVADGVGEFQEGAAYWSNMLVENMHKQVKKMPRHTIKAVSPFKALHKAFEAMPTSIIGSTTVTMAILDNEGALQTLNLGDSTFLVFRKGKIIVRGVEFIEHGGMAPAQIGPRANSPFLAHHGALKTVPLELGDIILLATDGIFDNLYDEDLNDLILDNYNSLSSMVAKIIRRAVYSSTFQRAGGSPFTHLCRHAVEKKRQGSFLWGNTGKPDDMSVVIGRVTAKSGK